MSKTKQNPISKRQASRSMDKDQIAYVYSELCDVVERAYEHYPVASHLEEAFRHTSEYARQAAGRIMDLLSSESAKYELLEQAL